MKTLRQIMTLLVMACIVFASSTAFAASLQDEVSYEVNLERTAAGIQPLSGIVYLDQAAGTRAQEAGILFAHQRPDGSPVKSVLNGASCSWFGENLAISSAVDAKKIVRAWMGSPTHRANLLNHHFTKMVEEICVRGNDGRYYWAMELVGD